MELEERYIFERAGRENPFRVPDGYFDQLTQRVMTQLPERNRKSRLVALRPWLYAAACTVVAVVLAVTFLFQEKNDDQQMATTTISSTYDNSYMDDAADYAMIDNVEIYACLAEN